MWKSLISEDLAADDLRDIDSDAACHLDQLGAYFCPTASERELTELRCSFEKKYNDKQGSSLYFTFVDGDGCEEELILNGRSTRVTFDSLPRYYEALLTRQLHRYDKGLAAMTRGLSEVVPLRALCLLSWRDLETLVSGHAVFDIPLWKANTETLSTLSPRVVALFWKVMEGLSPEEHEGFVRFAWGRSRLPSSAEEFVVKMKLGPTGSKDAKLPIAHVSSSMKIFV